MKANLHTHTFRCGHAVGTEEEYVRAAIAAGVKAIWNFTNAILEVPAGIVKEDIYFSDSLLTLEYYMAEMLDEEAKRAARGK